MPATQTLTLRPALPPDEPFLVELYVSTRAEEMAATGWPAHQQLAFLRQQYDARRASYALQFPQAVHSIVCANGERIGSLIVDHTENEVRIVDIALTPKHRNKGVGRSLLGLVIADAHAASKPLSLHVLNNNRAQRLYRRLGFKTTGVKGEYIAMTCEPRVRK